MKKLHLQTAENIQGEFVPKDINLMIVFQVNCPGCIASALPMVQDLYEKYGNKIGVLGLSTAFQYYDKNNAENTKRLVEEGHLVGHSLEIMERHGHKKLPYTITFPVLMDEKVSSDNKEEVAQIILENHPSYSQLTDEEKSMATKRIIDHLNKQSDVFITFAVNQFRGSPSFVLFDKEHQIINTWFGHQTKETILDAINAMKN